jgi:GntR family transcriptional regulator/MocR family aminotransferase
MSRTSNAAGFEYPPSLWNKLLPALASEGTTLQSTLRSRFIDAILDRRVPPGTRLPSSRELASLLKISRNTVVLVFEQLVAEGYLDSRPRSGYFVNAQPAPTAAELAAAQTNDSSPDWERRLAPRAAGQKWLERPRDWQQYPFPFIYGQFDVDLFPVDAWRECSHLALAQSEVNLWAADAIDRDDPLLIEQLRRNVLPRRGIEARPQEIMITLGTQNAIFLLAATLVKPGAAVAVEDPGYMDARNILRHYGARVVGVPVDENGMTVAQSLTKCDLLYCTPSHQCPTGVTMTTDRRLAILRQAVYHDFAIIEDDYDAETQYSGHALPSLKALDRSGRVIYVGGVSKTLSPGLRIGYVVGPEQVIERARELRRLVIRHPPANNQRALALFIAQGHNDQLLRRIRSTLAVRAAAITAALHRHLPEFRFVEPTGGSAIWLQCPEGLDTTKLAEEALRRGVVIEPGVSFFPDPAGPVNYMRLGYSSIPAERIELGILALKKSLP